MRRTLGSVLFALVSLAGPSVALADGPSPIPPGVELHYGSPAVQLDIDHAGGRASWGPGWGTPAPVQVPPPAPVYAPEPVYPPAPAPAWGWRFRRSRTGNPSFVASQIRAEVSRAARDLRFDIEQGAVRPEAWGAFEAGHDEIERDLAEASRKGFITPEDRGHLEAHVGELRQLRDRFRAGWDDSGEDDHECEHDREHDGDRG